jgi:hypothetical protein
MRDKIHLDKSGAAGRSNHRASARARSVAPPNRSRHASTAATSDQWNLREQPVNRRRDDLQQQGNNRLADRKLVARLQRQQKHRDDRFQIGRRLEVLDARL